MKKWVKVT
ncbi:Protein of unknown function [Bacillus mycoides]|nr:Protein of unknown function [Bacillus mycoides]